MTATEVRMPMLDQGTIQIKDHAEYSEVSAPGRTGFQYKQYERIVGIITMEPHRIAAWRSRAVKRVVTVDRMATIKKPVVQDENSRR